MLFVMQILRQKGRPLVSMHACVLAGYCPVTDCLQHVPPAELVIQCSYDSLHTLGPSSLDETVASN